MQSHVDYPWTKYPRDHEEVASIECQYPVILKPAKREKINRFTDDKAWRVDNQNELLARYEEACQYVPADQIMVQDFVPGSGETQFAFAALCDEGRTIACLTAQRRRQYPAEFGRASTYVVTLDEPKVEDSARRILSRMRYSGIVEVEFKLDERDGRYKLLDINTRAWGWHTIGKAAGIDYPHLLWRMVQGEIISPVRAQAGVRWAYMLPNALVAAQEIWQGKLSPVAFLWSLRPPLQSALFAVDDPAPSLLEFPLLLHRLWKRRRRIAASQQGSMLSNQVPAELSTLSSKATTRSAEGLTR
jgi:predicted ATP-grasp superfamily ATP-dependent carboligase